MPYTGPGDDKLPQNVQDLPEADRAQWVAVWNSVFNKCSTDGGKQADCEQSAFAQAWGVVNKSKKQSKLRRLFESLANLIVGEEPKERSLSIPAIYDQTYVMVNQQDPMAMLYDLYYDDTGVLYTICTANGKLYRIPLDVTDGIVTLGEWQEIIVEQSKAPSYRITRSAEGVYRWISISGSSVLNRSGEIDSRQFFDNMIKRAEKTGQYPIRVFFHAGKSLRTGQCDFMARDENLLITSGVYDQTELAQREIVARLKDPTAWGDSIGFYAIGPVSTLRANGLQIPVYNDGFCEEISTLPEFEAAAWFTGTPILKEERMLDQRQMSAFVKLFDGDEKAAKEWLEQNAETRNRQIADAGMITRAQADLEAVTQADAPAPAAADQPPADAAPAETPEAAPSGKPMGEIELDDAAIAAIAAAVAENLDPAKLAEEVSKVVKTELEDLTKRVEALESGIKQQAEAALATQQAVQRLGRDDEAKRKEWLEDMPAGQPARVTYRPRSQTQQAPAQASDVAAATLAKIPAKY